MKISLLVPILSLGALASAGCADGNLTQRHDSLYRALTTNTVTGSPVASNEVHTVVPLGPSGSQISPGKTPETTMVDTESPREVKQREAQDQLEDDLTKLDPK